MNSGKETGKSRWIILQNVKPYENPIATGPFSQEEVDKVLKEKNYPINPSGISRVYEKESDGKIVTVTLVPHAENSELI